MGLQPMGKVPDLRRLAGRVASRSAVRRSWLRTFLGFCRVRLHSHDRRLDNYRQ
jgi:hypothetical protein